MLSKFLENGTLRVCNFNFISREDVESLRTRVSTVIQDCNNGHARSVAALSVYIIILQRVQVVA